MVIISAINVPWALKINLTEERKLLVNIAVIINFENNLKVTKPKKKKQQKSMTEDYMYMQAKVHHSVFLKLFNGLWTIRARYLQKETAGDILRSVQIRYTEYNEQFKEMDKDQSGAGQNAFQFTFISKVIMHWKWILIFGAIERSKHWFFFFKCSRLFHSKLRTWWQWLYDSLQASLKNSWHQQDFPLL